jgi:hypothetical protein
MSGYLLSLNEVEQKRYEEFQNKHYSKHKFHGGVPVTITPTGIGDHIEVQCPKCNKKEDISNYEAW